MFSVQKYIFSSKIYFQYKNIFPVQKYISSTKIYFRLGKLKKSTCCTHPVQNGGTPDISITKQTVYREFLLKLCVSCGKKVTTFAQNVVRV